MAINKLNEDIGESSIKKIKARSMLKKQRLAIILMAAVLVLLVISLFVVKYIVEIFLFTDVDGTEYYIKKVDGAYSLCYKNGDVLDRNESGYYQTDLGTLVKIDPESGESGIYAVVDTEGTEEIGYQQYVLMFKQLTYDASSTKDTSKVIKSIEVHNDFGTYTFVRAEGNNFVIKDNEGVPTNRETFAQLAVACGYTLSMRRLEEPHKLSDGSVDYAEYGLAPETRTRIETDENGNEIEVEYEYQPAWYIITTMEGVSHKVIIGDMVVTGAGYYAKYEGRDTIYILSSQGITDVVLKGVEALVAPTIVSPMGTTTYFNVSNFIIYDNIDYDAIVAGLEDKFGDPDNIEGSIDGEEFDKYYSELFEKYSHKACHFSYRDLEERMGTMYSYLPYISELEYAGGYYINSSNIDVVLQNLCETDFTEVVKIAPSDEDFEKYGLDEAAYVISYYFMTKDDDGETVYVPNYVEISAKHEGGIYYAYSPNYNMIVGVSESSFDFLEWEEVAWYDPSYIQLDLSHVEEIIVESPGFKVDFEIEDSASRYMSYVAKTGKSVVVGEKTYNIVKDKNTGKYVLSLAGKTVDHIYKGDYLVTPLQYVRGVAESRDYIFVETKNFDLDKNGENDSMAYYFYNIAYNSKGECYLVAQVAIVDNAGNKLDNDRTVMGDPYLSTEYFVTSSNYLYLTSKNTYIGEKVEETYGSVGRGKWGKGNLFVTADEKYVLVNSETGEWCIIDDISCNIYFADKETSRLGQRGVEIPALYGSDGKIKRHPETFYPTTEEKLQYSEESNGIQVYNSKNKTWENATYADCTIGIWNSGAYYLIDGGNLIVVNEETGDWGIVTVTTNENYIAEIIANGHVLDYVIKTTNHVGRVENSTATDNFKQFYGAMLYASLEGMAELSEEEKAALRKLDDFSSENADEACQLKITILGKDLYGNRKDTVYRFYQFTERKSYITIEEISYEDGFQSSSEKAYGNFYVLRSYADKIIEDAKRIVNAEEVTAVTKY